ncbi:MAG: 4'-phosphopantetheinyl transferase, partial [Pirellulaceae bacterium]
GFCGAAVAATPDIQSIGIDAEENLPLPPGVLGLISSPREQSLPKEDADSKLCWDRLLFCVKESVFKAWYGITRAWLDFDECTIDWFPRTGLRSWGGQTYSGEFVANLERFYSLSGVPSRILQGRFVFNPKHLASLVVVPKPARSAVVLE